MIKTEKDNLTAAMRKLPSRLITFLEVHERFQMETPNPTDEALAATLGVTRDTIVNRRRRIRSFGIPLPPFRPRGFQTGIRRPRVKCPCCNRWQFVREPDDSQRPGSA